ncbi:helix-turn-helix domain-containing protein [Glycomyces xiaoerkulensis]|uniref:helix-turn-helix domain-containing protein n=1 Tax=Glycomyces xiaoerkulensis TaxID=2038139 RepID=UPI000C26578E|nr:helix-turn-helix transcriptional regulator [Glycomyces xiaoerkulensis]
MMLMRELLGETLRRRRRAQRRTLRDVSKQANVSLGYLSEIERGHKEPSSELLASVCGALQVRLSEVLAEVAREVASHEKPGDALTPQGRSVAVLPLPREVEHEAQPAIEEQTRRRRVAAASPASIAQVRSRHRRGEVTDSVLRAAA